VGWVLTSCIEQLILPSLLAAQKHWEFYNLILTAIACMVACTITVWLSVVENKPSLWQLIRWKGRSIKGYLKVGPSNPFREGAGTTLSWVTLSATLPITWHCIMLLVIMLSVVVPFQTFSSYGSTCHRQLLQVVYYLYLRMEPALVWDYSKA